MGRDADAVAVDRDDDVAALRILLLDLDARFAAPGDGNDGGEGGDGGEGSPDGEGGVGGTGGTGVTTTVREPSATLPIV